MPCWATPEIIEPLPRAGIVLRQTEKWGSCWTWSEADRWSSKWCEAMVESCEMSLFFVNMIYDLDMTIWINIFYIIIYKSKCNYTYNYTYNYQYIYIYIMYNMVRSDAFCRQQKRLRFPEVAAACWAFSSWSAWVIFVESSWLGMGQKPWYPNGCTQLAVNGWLFLVGGWPTLLKHRKVSWDGYSQESHNPFMFQTTNQW